MITLKKGALEHYVKAQRRKAYIDNPAYKKRCEMCGAKVVFRHSEITLRNSLSLGDYATCPECGNRIKVLAWYDPCKLSYWRWRLFYEKKCGE